jgi:hypothetical protein
MMVLELFAMSSVNWQVIGHLMGIWAPASIQLYDGFGIVCDELCQLTGNLSYFWYLKYPNLILNYRIILVSRHLEVAMRANTFPSVSDILFCFCCSINRLSLQLFVIRCYFDYSHGVLSTSNCE